MGRMLENGWRGMLILAAGFATIILVLFIEETYGGIQLDEAP